MYRLKISLPLQVEVTFANATTGGRFATSHITLGVGLVTEHFQTICDKYTLKTFSWGLFLNSENFLLGNFI